MATWTPARRCTAALLLALTACADVDPNSGAEGRPDQGEGTGDEEEGSLDVGDETGEAGAGTQGGESEVQLELEEVQYALEWAPFDASSGAPQPGDAFALTTDLGYQVRVQSAHLTVRGMTLLDCSGALEVGADSRRLAHMAVQAKSDGAQTDPTSVYHGYVEDLALREAADFGAQTFDAQPTCGVHFVLGQAPATALNMPSEPDMLARTLLLQGSAQLGETGTPIEFSIDIHHADGLVTAWDAASVDFAGGRAARVVVVRDLNSAFDGIDFATATQMQLDISVLHNLATHAQIRVEDPT